VLIRTCFDDIDRTDIITGSAVGTEILVDDVKIPLLADGVHWTDIVTGSTIDTIFGDIVRSHLDTSLLADFDYWTNCLTA
jgi:hypothetical protein